MKDPYLCAAPVINVLFILTTIIISLFSVFFPILFHRCSFLINNAIEKILTLTRRKERFLVVAVVRFMRTIISRNVCFLLLCLCSFIFIGCNSVVLHIGCTNGFGIHSLAEILITIVKHSMNSEIIPTRCGIKKNWNAKNM
jgi:hypothetical protein